MKHELRRGLQAVVGLLGVTLSVVWLSGGCESRVAPGEADLRAETGDPEASALVEEVEGPSIEWTSGEITSARHTAVASRVLARIDDVRVRAQRRVDVAAGVAGVMKAVRVS